MPKKAIISISMLIFLCLTAFWGVYQLQPPEVVPASAPEDRFSAERALVHLKKIAEKPHPIGSREHQQVKEYIFNEIKKLGFKPEIQKTEVTKSRINGFAVAATVENILLRIPGTDSHKAILLMSHYDTVPNAFGATDDGSGNVAMLETLRALTNLPPMKNDVIFLFSDGEEIGLMGAKAFAEQHPWAKDVGLVLNLEGAGSSGQSIMFESSDNNLELIRRFARVSSCPVANSLSYEIYKRMPNDTDFSVFKKRGIPGLNFAYIDDKVNYHTANDDLEHIDLRSVQHHGDYLLELTRHFGNSDLNTDASANAVYFNSIGFHLVHYSVRWVIPFMLLVILLFTGILILGHRQELITLKGVFSGLLAFIINLMLAPVLIGSLYQIIAKAFTGINHWLLLYHQKSLLLAFVCLAVAISFSLYNMIKKGIKLLQILLIVAFTLILLIWGGLFSWPALGLILLLSAATFFSFRKQSNEWNFILGGLSGWMVIMILVSVLMPGGSYLVTWPLFFALVPVFIILLKKDTTIFSLLNSGLLAIFAIPGVLWFSGFVYLYFSAMGLQMITFVMVLAVIPVGILIPHLFLINSYKNWLYPGVLTLAGTVLLLFNTAGVSFDDQYKKPFAMFFVNDFDTNQSFWVSDDLEIDEWQKAYFSGQIDTVQFSTVLPHAGGKIIKSITAADLTQPPEVELVADLQMNGGRELQLHLKPGLQFSAMAIYIENATPITEVKINDMELGYLPITTQNDWLRWQYYTFPAEGITVTIKLKSKKPIGMKLVEFGYGLQSLLKAPIPPRVMPAPYSYSDRIVSLKTFNF